MFVSYISVPDTAIEHQAGRPAFYVMRRCKAEHQLEAVCKELRSKNSWLDGKQGAAAAARSRSVWMAPV